jgi:hypothetical protein
MPMLHPLGGLTPAWLGQLAEELAGLIEAGDRGALVNQRIRDEAREHHLNPWILTDLVAREWDRLGIIRVPLSHAVGGW